MSHLPAIIGDFYNQLRRIDDLESRIEERARKTRRRFATLLPQYRHSRVRLFTTHNVSGSLEEPSYQLLLEGRLLVDHLDVLRDDKSGLEAPPQCTQFFDAVSVELQPFYQPRPNPMARIATPPPKPTKSGRRGTNKQQQQSQEEPVIDEASLVAGPKCKLGWTSNLTPDAPAWAFAYKPPPPPESRLMHAQVKCVIHLLPRRQEELYKPAPALAQIVFPNLALETMDNDMRLPHGLTMKQVIQAIFIYLQDKDLPSDPADASTIYLNDNPLQALLQTDRLVFSQLQSLLLQHNLLQVVTRSPMELVYTMRPSTAETNSIPDASVYSDVPHALLQLDLDVTVPTYSFHRNQHLLRRSQQREHDMIQARVQAKILLQSRSPLSSHPNPSAHRVNKATTRVEETLKSLMEQAEQEHVLDAESIVWYNAMSQQASKHGGGGGSSGEWIRTEHQLNVQLCHLLQTLQEEQQLSKQAWAVVDTITSMGSSSSSSSSSNSSSLPHDDDGQGGDATHDDDDKKRKRDD